MSVPDLGLTRNYSKSLLVIKLVLIPETPILIGRGVLPGENVRETLILQKNGEKYFVIPASSLKGVFRKISYSISLRTRKKYPDIIKLAIESHIEDKEEAKRLEHKIQNDETNLKLIEEFYTGNKQFMDEVCYSTYRMSCKELRSFNMDEFIDIVLSISCPICNLYGSRYYRSALLFKSVLIKYDYSIVDSRPHVAIDRSSRTSVKNALYTDRLFNMRGKDLDLFIIVRDIEPKSVTSEILATTLEYISEAGLIVGGGKSIGYGLLKVDPERTMWYYKKYSSLKEYLKPKVRKGLSSLIEFLKKP